MTNDKSLPEKLHFVGIGGIGMSGLAQFAITLGCQVSGSDRAWDKPENARIMNALRSDGIRLFPQDGSAYADGLPDAIVYSTAVEEGNPDFSGPAAAVPRIHRSEALARAIGMLDGRHLIAVAGTCGKTSVSAWLGEALVKLNADPGILSGGLVNSFVSDVRAGNFRGGNGPDFVIEADESDKSLLNYSPDTSLILNIGTDHYPREILAEIFREFIRKTSQNVVICDDALLEIGPDSIPAEKHVEVFSVKPDAPARIGTYSVRKLNSYRISNRRVYCSFDGQKEIELPAPGLHNAANALAIYCTLLLRGYAPDAAAASLHSFSGVWRRFDRTGVMKSGAVVIDDYAHNAEKIRSAVGAIRELSPDSRSIILFQPHGFTPLKFMRDELYKDLCQILRPNDVFAFLPVYYAGGTAAFSPTSDEVALSYAQASGKPDQFRSFSTREEAERFLKKEAGNGDFVLIAGARDNSLSDWAKKITKLA